MSLILRYEADAVADLRRIIEYGIEQGHTDPVAYVRGLRDRLGLLREYPLAGREGRLERTRELVIANTPFVAIYLVQQPAVLVLRILHGAQQWPAANSEIP